MLNNSPESLNNLNTPILSLQLQIVKRDGPNLSESLYPYSLQVKSPSGTLAEYGLRETDSQLLEAVLQDPNLWLNFSRDRKRVVSGKSVSGRDNLGGDRHN